MLILSHLRFVVHVARGYSGYGLPMADLVQEGFSFANRYKMVLEYQHPERPPVLYYVEPLKSAAIIEVSRVVKNGFTPQAISADEFDKKLTDAYQRDSSEARQLMEDIGADNDDFFSLAEELPQDEDLLESEDDAPIILKRYVFGFHAAGFECLQADVTTNTVVNVHNRLTRFMIYGSYEMG